jgi:hypothetical protein
MGMAAGCCHVGVGAWPVLCKSAVDLAVMPLPNGLKYYCISEVLVSSNEGAIIKN